MFLTFWKLCFAEVQPYLLYEDSSYAISGFLFVSVLMFSVLGSLKAKHLHLRTFMNNMLFQDKKKSNFIIRYIWAWVKLLTSFTALNSSLNLSHHIFLLCRIHHVHYDNGLLSLFICEYRSYIGSPPRSSILKFYYFNT